MKEVIFTMKYIVLRECRTGTDLDIMVFASLASIIVNSTRKKMLVQCPRIVEKVHFLEMGDANNDHLCSYHLIIGLS